MNRRLSMLLLCGLAFAAVSCSNRRSDAGADNAPNRPQGEAKVFAWAQEVVLGTEFGNAEKVVARWADAPSISIFNADDKQQRAVERALDDIDSVLRLTPIKKLRRMEANRTDANIEVHFLPLAAFGRFGKNHNFNYVEGNWGYFHLFWNGRNEITKAYVLLATDKLRDRNLNHFALEEITQSLGLANDSGKFADSIFYGVEGDGGSAQKLSESDRKLLRFVYTRLSPGDGPRQVREALRKYWDR